MRLGALVAIPAGLAAAALAAVTSLGGTTGCTLTEVDSGTSDAGTQTVGTQCSAIASALCSAYAMCAQAEPSDCTQNFNAGCCSGSVCDETSQTSSDTVAECVDTYTMSPDCNALANATTPSACSGIPQAP